MSAAVRVVFIVERKNYYRVFGPVVDAALRRGWAVECWHDWAQPRSGPKGSEFPDEAPPFRWGQPRVRTYHGTGELARRLTDAPPDAVIAPAPPPPGLERRIPWIGLQHLMSFVYFEPQRLASFDRIASSSPYWLHQILEYFRASGAFDGRGAAIAEEISARFTSIGVPELDQVSMIDPAAVRAKFGLPEHRPVVLYLSYPLNSDPQTFWLRHVYRPRSRLRRGLAVVAARQFRYWPYVARNWNDARLVDAVRAFCDANGALLVVKSRLKDPVPRYAQQRANLVLYDQSYYPATILELLSIASLCVHFFSSSAYESVFLGVPSLCIAPSPADMQLPPWAYLLAHVREGGMYNFPGASYYRSLPDAFDDLPRCLLKDFPCDALARASFVNTFIGFDDTRSSERFLDVIEGLGSGA